MTWSSAGAGSAPGWAKTRIPSRNAISVGIDWIPAAEASSCCSSVLIEPNVMSGLASEAAS